jgi:hypothetical protein
VLCTHYGAPPLCRLATGLTVRGSNPGGDETFRTCPDRPWTHQASCTMGIRPISRGKAIGGWGSLPTPSGAEVKENVELYFYSAHGASWSVIGRSLPFISLSTFLQFPGTSSLLGSYTFLSTLFPNFLSPCSSLNERE